MPSYLSAAILPIALVLQAQGATLAPRGLSAGTILYGEPIIVDLVRPATVPVQLDAVIAEQRAEVMGARRILDSDMRIGAPFNYDVPAGSVFRAYRTVEGTRWCETHGPGVVYTPAHDEHRDIYPGICLVNANPEGTYESVRMVPYPPLTQYRDVPIAAARLRPAPPVTDPRIFRLQVFQRLRLSELGERDVTIALEYAEVHASGGTADYGAHEPVQRVILALRPGATASIAGIALRMEGGPGAWRIAALNSFTPWALLEDGGAAFRAGPYYLAPRED